MYIQYLSAKIQIQISKYVSRIQLIANLKLKKKNYFEMYCPYWSLEKFCSI